MPNCASHAIVYKRPRAMSLPAGALSSQRRDRDDSLVVPTRHMRISYSDDALCKTSLANMYRLVQAAQESADAEPGVVSSATTTLARKALQYRKKLVRARAADVGDPTFDVAVFMGVTWCKVANTKR